MKKLSIITLLALSLQANEAEVKDTESNTTKQEVVAQEESNETKSEVVAQEETNTTKQEVVVQEESNETKSDIVEPTEKKAEGIKYIKMLGGALKTALQKEMKADPTGVKALEFCTNKADEITKEVNKELPEGASVRRTALKVRAKDNIADPADEGVMEVFEKAANEKALTPKNIIAVDLNDSIRVYKPLLVMPVCTKCHGENVSDELKAKIKESYPEDQAMGFKEGDFRGVIVSEIKK